MGHQAVWEQSFERVFLILSRFFFRQLILRLLSYDSQMGSRIASASDPGTFCPNRVWPSTRVLWKSQQKSNFLNLNDFLELKTPSSFSRLFPLKLRSATAVTLPKSPGLLGPITYLTSRPEAYFCIVIQHFKPIYLFKCLDSFQYRVTLTSSEIVNLKVT